MLPSRLVGVVFVTLPLLARGRLRMTRLAAPLVVLMGVLEVIGVIGIGVGSQDSIAITVVLSSQFAMVSVLGGYLLFSERLARSQLIGVALIAVGVASVAITRA